MHLALTGLVLFSVAWSLWAVVLDQRPTGSDTFTPKLVDLAWSLEHGQIVRWLRSEDPKGPVPAFLALPLLYLVGDGPLAARLLSVLSHVGLILLAFALGRQIAGRPSAGLWAALLCAGSPMVFGWCRLDYPEPLTALFVLAALALMLRPRLPFLLLGLCLALGLMVKLSFAVLMVGPALWLLARQLRTQGARGLLPLLACLAVFLAAVSPWLLHNMRMVLVNMGDTHHELGMLGRARTLGYFHLPSVAPLLAMATMALPVLWVARPAGRWALALPGLCALVSLAIFLTSFTYWSRYLMPTVTVLAVLAGCGLDWAQQQLRPGLRRGFGAAAVLLLLGQVGWVSLAGLPQVRPREQYSGLLTPETRPHVGYRTAIAALRPFDEPVLAVYDSVFAMHRTEGTDAIWRRRGVALPRIGPRVFVEDYRSGRQVSVLLFRGASEGVDLGSLAASSDRWFNILPHDTELYYERDLMFWLARQLAARRLTAVTDPDGLRYEALRVTCGPVPPRRPRTAATGPR